MTSDPVAPSRRRSASEAALAALSFVRAGVELRGTRRGTRVRCHGRVLVPQRSGIEIGQRAVFFAGTIPTELRCEPGAELVIGSRTLLNYGVSIAARRSVRIGSGCMIASLVHIRDDDGRTVRPVTIGNNVWIAFGAVIEPGATIGDGAVIATMAVVSGTVPARSLATGNPAQSIPMARERTPLSTTHGEPGLSAPDVSASQSERSRSPSSQGLGASRHSADEVRIAIVEWLDDTRHFGATESLIRDDAMPLRAGGILDSLGVVQLVLMLEKRFGVSIDRERVAAVDSLSMGSFVRLVTHAPGRG